MTAGFAGEVLIVLFRYAKHELSKFSDVAEQLRREDYDVEL
jgi:hypothetical protein